MSQTTVTEYQDQYVAGQIHNPNEAKTRTHVVNDSNGIPYGRAVIKGTAENEVKNPTAAFTKAVFRGIAAWTPVGTEKALLTGTNTVANDEEIYILKTGVISVLVTDTVTEGGTVFYTHTTGGASTLYTFRSDLDTDKASEIPAVFLEDGVTGDIVKIQLMYAAGIGSILT